MGNQGDKKIEQIGLPSTAVLDLIGLPALVLKAASSIALLVGCSVLLGWTLDIDVLKRILPGLVAMNPTTAIAFVLAGVSLWLLRTQNTASRPRRIAQGLAFTVALVGLIKLVEVLWGWDVGIDQLLFAEKLEQEEDVTGFVNRMAPNTALNFFLLGGALWLLGSQTRRGYWLAQSFSLVAVAASLLAILGYAYGVKSFYGVASYIPMALHTALTFLLLLVGLLCARPDRGLMAIITSDSMGGVVARRLLPAAILLQLALGWLRLAGQQAGLYGTELGVALMVMLSIVVLTILIGWSASLLHRSDTGRKRAEEKLRQAYEELDIRVQERTAELAIANAALRESEERFRLLVEDVQGYAIFSLDPEGRVASWNEGAELIKGYETAEIIGEHFSVFYPEEDVRRGKPKHALEVAAAEGRIEDEGWRVRKDGSCLWASVVVTALRNEAGELRGFSKVTRDITERKRNEDELKERAEELARSNAELEQFAYVASHDLQEPLRMVSSYTQLLARRYKDRLDSDADEFINYAVDGANRMQILIHDLLAYSRVGTRSKELVPTDVGGVIDAACSNLRQAIDESGAEVTSDELPTVMGDHSQLVQLFQNLIGNAIKFQREQPVRIHVGAARRDGEWLFSVCDNGIGIAPQYAEQIFVIFKRLHGKGEYSGTGIGLAVCKKIAERHGGRIWVDSEPGIGSTFHFTLRS